ncbi:nickel/cobalt transporter [Psychromonas hadalis]|uniref:nickel/cobalt transporter n=1 Tax=Psychromonas hadalis TaxID=211669 RepID=UPI0003B3C5A5|nr:membrane protein [Psychromonas hadalis]
MNKPLSTYLGTIFVAIIISLVMMLWHFWPAMILQATAWQRDIYQQLATMLYQSGQADKTLIGYFLGFSFIYGLLHSLGPGHGKFIVSSYLLTYPSRYKSSLYLTVYSAFLQAVTAIVLVSVGKYLFTQSMRTINEQAYTVSSYSFYFIIALGFFMLLQITYFLLKGEKHKAGNCGCCPSTPIKHDSKIPYSHSISMGLSIGLRPCSGALMVLLLAASLQLYWLGIVSALAMAFGTAVTTSSLALLTISGAKVATFYGTKKESHQQSKIHYALLFKVCTALFFILLGVLLISSQPVEMKTFF